MAREITNYDDIIDSRDVIERLAELAGRWQDHANNEPDSEPLDDDEKAEMEALGKLAEEAEGYAPDWQYGEALIRDSYFKEYAMELADDIGAINREMTWPLTCIDWDQAARELQMDYTSVSFDGVDYWIR